VLISEIDEGKKTPWARESSDTCFGTVFT